MSQYQPDLPTVPPYHEDECSWCGLPDLDYDGCVCDDDDEREGGTGINEPLVTEGR